MPFFFRKLRAKLPEKNRVLNYSLYALGEIIVVVIGILIALAVTNANEASKRRQDFMTRLDVIEKELRADIPDLNDLIYTCQIRDSLTDMVLQGNATKASYANGSETNRLLTSFVSFEARVGGMQSIIAHINDVPPEYDTLVKQISELISLASTIDENWEDAKTYMLKVNDDWADHYPWFISLVKKDSSLSEERINYFLKDEIYKNRLAYFSILVDYNMASNIRYYREQAINTLIRIRLSKNISPEEIMLEMTDLLSLARHSPFISLDSAMDLSLGQLKLSKRKTSNFLLYNKLLTSVKIYQHYAGATGEDHIFSLAPGEIKFLTDRNFYFYSVKSLKDETVGHFQKSGLIVIE